MAFNPMFEGDSTGAYQYDQGMFWSGRVDAASDLTGFENSYPDLPPMSASGRGDMDYSRVDHGNFYLPEYNVSAEINASIPALDPYLNTGSQYSTTWDAVGSSTQERQWPDFENAGAMNPPPYISRNQREYYRNPTTPFPQFPQQLPYGGFASTHTRSDVEYYGPSQRFKRPISEVDGDDDAESPSTPVQNLPRKRLRSTGETLPQGPAPARRSKKPKAEKKRKAITRPARKDRVQGNKGAGHNPKGMLRRNPEGRLEWRESNDSEWGPAGYHNDFRAELIASDYVEGEYYDEEPAVGEDSDPLNVTSYCSRQRHWTANKASVLDEQNRQVLHMLDPPADWVHNPKVAPMKHKGITMLDHDGFPVRDFPGVPKVLSTLIEPFRQEGLRRCTGMTIPDFRARMPSHRRKGGVMEDLQTPQAFTNRMSQWRIVENVGTWLERDGSQQIKDYIKDQLPDPELKTTESLLRLDPEQKKKVYGLNKGRYQNKSRYERAPEDDTATPSEGGHDTKGSGARKKRVRRSGSKSENKNGVQIAKGKRPAHASADLAESSSIRDPTPQQVVATSAAVEPQAPEPDLENDYRFSPPTTAAQAATIQAALYYTRADYAYQLGEEAPVTPAFDSYVTQYLELQNHLAARWDYTRGDEPTLMGLDAWVGGWDKWQQPNVSEEEFRRLLPKAG